MLRTQLARLEEKVHALDRLTDEKFVTISAMMEFEADKVALALAAQDKAVTKAENATEKRFESVNEFRQTLSDQATTMVSKAEYNAMVSGLNAEHVASVKSITEKLEEMKARLDRAEGRGVGLNAGWIYLLGIVAAIGTLISIVLVIRT